MPRNFIACTVVAALSSGCAHTAPVAQRSAANEQIFIYYYDELAAALEPGARENPRIPRGVAEARRHDPIFVPCGLSLPASPPNVAAAASTVMVPLLMFGFKLFTSAIDAALSARDKRRLAALSKSYSQLRSDDAFPALQGLRGHPRCLVVDRMIWDGGKYQSGAAYVFGLRPVGQMAFTLEPLLARVDSTPVVAAQRELRVNVSVSLAFQSVQSNQPLQRNDLTTLPAYSVTFEGLPIGALPKEAGSRFHSPVLPIASSTSPTSVAAAVTEAHVSLASEKERVALEQANRAALFAAIGESVKTALTD